MPGGDFRLLVNRAGGAPFTKDEATNVQLYATPDLSSSFADWVQLSLTGVLTNGALQFDDPETEAIPQEFYRAVENR